MQFRKIANVYISAGSKLEINIGTAMQKRVLEVCSWSSFNASHVLPSQHCGEKRQISDAGDDRRVRPLNTRLLCKDWRQIQASESYV